VIKKIEYLEAENKRLKEALVDVLNQACYSNKHGYLNDEATSAYEGAFDLLEQLKLAKWHKSGWEIFWKKLNNKE